jgi:CheY-like chemotaxis protein
MTQTKKILLVDDQADAIDALSMLLEMDGHAVRTACSGADALAMVENFIPDLALIDVSMPDMSGMQLARILRNNAALANTSRQAGGHRGRLRRARDQTGFGRSVGTPYRGD